jgi:protein TonB
MYSSRWIGICDIRQRQGWVLRIGAAKEQSGEAQLPGAPVILPAARPVGENFGEQAGSQSSKPARNGLLLSCFAHLALASAALAWFNHAPPFEDPGSAAVDVMMVVASPPPSLKMPAPPVPAQLSAVLLPSPDVPMPPEQIALAGALLPPPDLPPPSRPDVLAAELLPPPDLPPPASPVQLAAQLLPALKLPAPAAPAALPVKLLPPPKVALPPVTPDPAGIFAVAVPAKLKVRSPTTGTAGPKEINQRQARENARQRDRQKAAKQAAAKARQTAAKKRAEAKRKEARKLKEASRLRQAKKVRQAKRLREARKRQQDRQAAARASRTQRTRIAARQSSRNARASTSTQARLRGRQGMSPASWRNLIASRLRRNKPSGFSAQLSGGTAVVSFRIAANGAARSVRLVRSAGDKTLDRAALATVRRSSPFPPPPPGVGRSFRVPVSFRR